MNDIEENSEFFENSKKFIKEKRINEVYETIVAKSNFKS